ncbi:MAG TPA: type II toxin-antitoxin system HigB family toxin [Stellaceae bacterium]|nr:type II toxin-antitoxin system HigB family toxin [Stellaceae bacterium]
MKERLQQRAVRTWYATVSSADWTTPADIKSQFGTTVDFIADNRVIFDIGGNKFRLIVRVVYRFKAVQIKFIGTHAEYDRIDPVTCEMELGYGHSTDPQRG